MPDISNRISLNIPEADIEKIQAAVKVLQDLLEPHLVDLGPDERRVLPKMGDKTVSFVDKALEYARTNPELCPPFVNVEEFERDMAAVDLLLKLQRPLAQIADLVDDSLLLAGSEAYSAALACYHTIKGAARLNVAGAGTIAEDLGRQFTLRSGRGGAVAEGAVAAGAAG